MCFRFIGGTALALAVLAVVPARADIISFDPQSGSYGSAVYGDLGGTSCGGGGLYNIKPGCFLAFSPDQIVGGSDSNGLESAASTASLALGVLSASASTSAVSPYSGSAFASAVVWNTLTFEGAAPGAIVTLTMSGSSSGATDAGGFVLAPFNGVPYTIGSVPSVLGGNTLGPVSGNFTLTEPFAIKNGIPYEFVVAVVAGVDIGDFVGGVSESAISDPYSLDLPAGVTVTSAAPLSPVPEASSLPMLLAGLGMIGGAFYFGRKKAKSI